MKSAPSREPAAPEAGSAMIPAREASNAMIPAREAGNAMIYVLIVIALFAALAFILARQSGSGESGSLSSNQIEIDATQILQTAMQVKQAVDGMTYSGSTVDTLDFKLPSDTGYDTPPNGQKVFHPDGGGVVLPRLPDDAVVAATDPAPGWYLGRFNNVEWTPTAATDVVMAAYNIAKPVCAKLNQKITGSSGIPAATAPLRTLLVSATRHSGTNQDFTAAICTGCKGYPALCVQEPGGAGWSFYSLVESR